MSLKRIYRLLQKDATFEVRDYESLSLAKVLVTGPFESAHINGKSLLYNYLSGHNYKKAKINEGLLFMMFPHVHGWEVSCLLPEKYLHNDPPKPVGSNIQFEKLNPRTVAVCQFRGKPAYASMMRKTDELKKWASSLNFEFCAHPRIVVYDSSIFTLARRNEIQLDRIM